ncbi:MAG: hypothetical protein A3C47_07420 [Omnitrophica bacterium RIFCSPHIGHO2_02_FULL_51_18]|nr:MAG: hypothetical protein A3C47_07420 [Omnitrophica bacterium RIFCSPHIGHO2_02_FULL_51_18]
MKSDLPKALHSLCGRPMIWHLLDKVKTLEPKKILVVVGHRKELVQKELGPRVQAIRQTQQLGSGHAVNQAAQALSGFNGRVLVLYCDTPLIKPGTLRALVRDQQKKNSDCSLLSAEFSNPFGYGRIRRTLDGSVGSIIEENDAGPAEKRIREINVGCYVFRSKKLFQALKYVRQNPKKKEVYLTDAIALLAQSGKVSPVLSEDPAEMLGVNTRKDLSRIQSLMQKEILETLVEKGVLIRDPRTTVIDADVKIGGGSTILPNTVIEEGSRIGKGCRIGPFARVRGRSRIEDGAVIGNFVEVVRSTVGRGSNIKHLSYIGDAEIGRGVNIGAGTITANYDGKKKHKTVIKDKAQIGSGTILIAPVTVGRMAKTGAGSVVTKGTRIKDGAVVAGVPAKELI